MDLIFHTRHKKNGNGPPSIGVEPTYHIGHRKPEVIYYITEI
jgi:hypothetical protein